MKYNKSRIAFCQACSNEAHGVKTRIAVEHTCGIAVPVSEMEKKEEENLGSNNGISNCPFCGGQEGESVILGRLPHSPMFKIACVPCGVTLVDDRKDKVIANWNQRKSPTLRESLAGEIWDAAVAYTKGARLDKNLYIKSLLKH